MRLGREASHSRQVIPSGSATLSPKRSPSLSRRSGARANSTRRKNVPPSGSVEYWSERTMLAPVSNRKRETLATMPGRSGQDISRRTSPGCAEDAVTAPRARSRRFELHRRVLELGDLTQVLDPGVDLAARQPLDPLGAEFLDAERGQGGPVGHGLAERGLARRAVEMAREVAHESAR